jgi:phosphate/sulfate permease
LHEKIFVSYHSSHPLTESQTELLLKPSLHSIGAGIRAFLRGKRDDLTSASKAYLRDKQAKWASLSKHKRIAIILVWTLSPVPGGIIALMAELSLSLKDSEVSGKVLAKILKDRKSGSK